MLFGTSAVNMVHFSYFGLILHFNYYYPGKSIRMKNLIFVIILSFLTFGNLEAGNYKKVKIYLQEANQISRLVNAGVTVDHFRIARDNSISLFITDEEYSIVKQLGFRTDVLIDNWAEYYNKRQAPTEADFQRFIQAGRQASGVSNFTFGSMGGYYTLAEAEAQLDSMRAKFPSLITAKMPIGKTVEGRNMYAVKISANADIENSRPEVLFTSETHSREAEGLMQLIYFMYYLLENYNTDAQVKYLVDNRNIYFIPLSNPDGYEYNYKQAPNGGGMWRKNRAKNSDGSFGVDLNRNYGPYAYWDSPNLGSSSSPFSDTYRGPAPFSEPETQIIRDFLASRKFKTALNYHTYGNDLIYPYSAFDYETPDSLVFREYSSIMTRFNHFICGTDLQTVGYSTRGSSDDFFYDGDTLTRGKIISMTPEIGAEDDDFWPLQSRIIPIALESIYPNLFIIGAAGPYVKLENYSLNKPYFSPGETLSMKITVNNIGLAPAASAKFRLVSLSNYAAVSSEQISVASLKERTKTELPSQFTITIKNGVAAGERIDFALITSLNGYDAYTDTISLRAGSPSFTFADTTNDISKLWTVASTPDNAPKWSNTTALFFSAPNCYTDSKDGNYKNSSVSTMTLSNPVQLPGGSKSFLTFKTRYDIETDYDYGQVEISTNGGSVWEPVKGLYSKTAVSSSQPAGKPVYDGMLPNWVTEEIDLGNYTGRSILMRFKLVSDSYLNKDGWYVDDIGIYNYITVPVRMNYFTGGEDEEGVKLIWQTASETNNYGFEVQKEITPGKFMTIGFVKGNGTTLAMTKYSFVDKTAVKGKNVYRLKQIDLNNSFCLYGPVEVEMNPRVKFALKQNFPNPFNPVTTIEYCVPINGMTKLQIYDLLGNLIAEPLNEYQTAGVYALTLSIDKYHLASGVYFYKLESGYFSDIKKFTVVK